MAHYRPRRIHPLSPKREEQLFELLSRLSSMWFSVFPQVKIRETGLLIENPVLSVAFFEAVIFSRGGKTSAKRKDVANSPAYKPFKLKYEMECKKTGKERSLCPCKKCKCDMKNYYMRVAKKRGVDERRASRQARKAELQSLPAKEKKRRRLRDAAAKQATSTTSTTTTTTVQRSTHELLVIAAAEVQRQRVEAAKEEEARRNFMPPDDFEDTMELLGLSAD